MSKRVFLVVSLKTIRQKRTQKHRVLSYKAITPIYNRPLQLHTYMKPTFVICVFLEEDYPTYITSWLQSQLNIVMYVPESLYETAIQQTQDSTIDVKIRPSLREMSFYDPAIEELPDIRNEEKDTIAHIWNTHQKVWITYHTMCEKEANTTKPANAPEYHYIYMDYDSPRLIQDVFSWSKLRTIYKRAHLYTPHYGTESMYLPGCWGPADTNTSFRNEIHWRFCGTFFLGSSDAIRQFYHHYETHFATFLQDHCKGTLSWEVNFWAWLEAHTSWTPQWYSADHNDRMLMVPKVFGYDLICDYGKQIEYDYPPLTPYRPMSAAYVCYQDQHYLNTRYVNYWIYDQGFYYYPEDEHVIRTYNVCSPLVCAVPGVDEVVRLETTTTSGNSPVPNNEAVWIPKSFHVMNNVLDPSISAKPNVFSEGIEDIRLYVSQETGELCFIGSTLEYSYNDRIRMIRGTYDVETFECKNVQLIIPPYDTWCEKNWAPIPLPDGADGFVYQWYPLEIGKVVGNIHGSPLGKMEIVIRKETDERLVGMKGSSNFTPYGETGLIGVVHFSEENSPRKYFHRILILHKKTFEIMMCSPIFCFRRACVEFCIGFRAWNGKFGFWISQMDRDPLYLETSSDFLWK